MNKIRNLLSWLRVEMQDLDSPLNKVIAVIVLCVGLGGIVGIFGVVAGLASTIK